MAGRDTPALKVNTSTETYRQAPYNIEAEQALLGAILVHNGELDHIGDQLLAEHFYEPLHRKIFTAIRQLNDRGQIANPVTLRHYFERDPAFAEVGGGEYLARLAGVAFTVINIYDYSTIIYDLALKRELIDIGQKVVNRAYDQELDQPAMKQIEEAEQSLFSLAAHGVEQTGFRPFSVGVGDAVRRAEFAFKNRGEVIGISTGLKDLDRLLGGLQPSDLVILAGRPSMGKTALATTIAFRAAENFAQKAPTLVGAHTDKLPSVGFFSLEMSSEQLANRVLAMGSGINSSKILRGELSNDDFSKLMQASHRLAQLPLFIDDTPALTISALRTRARRLKRVHNLGALVVDYLQLVQGSNSSKQNGRVQEVSEVTQGLKAIAKELNIPVLALSQLSRAVEQREDKRPQLSDLRESGSIEQDADVVMFVYRESYYLEREKPDEADGEKFLRWQEKMSRVHNVAEAIIAKQRHGPIGTARLAFFPDETRFADLADEAYMSVPEY